MSFLNDISIRLKVLAVPLVLVVATVIISFLSIYGLEQQGDILKTVSDIALQKITLVNQFDALSEQVQSDMFRVSVLRSMDLPVEEIQPVQARLSQGLSDLKVIHGQILKRWRLDPTEREILERMKKSMDTFRLQAEQAAAVVIDNPAFGVLLVRSATVPFDDFRHILAEFLDYQKVKIILVSDQSNQERKTITSTIIAIVLLIGLTATFAAVLSSNLLISAPVQSITDLMHRLAGGDLTVQVTHLQRRDEIGAMARAVEVFRDNAIEKAQLDKELRESEERYRLLFHYTPAAVFHYDPQLRITECNQRLADILESTWEKLIGLDMNQLNDQSVIPALNKALTGREGYYEGLYQATTGSGQPWITLHAAPVFDQDGKIKGGIALAENVTARRQVEEALRESEHLFRTLVEGAPDAIIVQTNHRFAYLNHAAISLFGLESEDQLIGRPIMERFHPAFRNMVLTRMRLLNEQNERVPNLEEIILRVDGTEVQVEVSAVPVNFKGQNGALVFFREITARKNMEKQLQQAQKMEAVGILAGGVAHDFNNILQVISGYTQKLLMNKNDNDLEYPSLQAILKASNRAAELIHQLLLFGRKVETPRRAIDINKEVRHTRDILERTIPKMVDMELHLASYPWIMEADQVQMEQILLNLGKNAADSMPDGGTLIIETMNVTLDEEYVRNHPGAHPGRYVLLTVSDTGHGMGQETVEHIFEPFFTTKEIGKGTGLGLASVYGIVKSHGGYITCNSALGKGTTFKIYLPATEQINIGESCDLILELPKSGTETILLVDDDESIKDVTQDVLVSFGYTVLTASSGEEALEIYSGKPQKIHLVVMDIGMPGMGGHKCLRELLKLDPSAKVLIASGYSINEQVKDTMDAGAAGFMGKPYQLTDLLDKVRAILDQPKSTA